MDNLMIVGTVREFNTGRLYAADGQRITWAIVERPYHSRAVAFIDHARGIEQVIELYIGNSDLITDRWVLNAYDNYHYHHGTDECALLRAEIIRRDNALLR